MPLITALKDQLPSFKLSVTIKQSSEMLGGLLDFEIDTAAISQPADDRKLATVFCRSHRAGITIQIEMEINNQKACRKAVVLSGATVYGGSLASGSIGAREEL